MGAMEREQKQINKAVGTLLKNPLGIGWYNYIAITKKFLKTYPAEIFTGSSKDKGPVFTTALRNALEQLEAE